MSPCRIPAAWMAFKVVINDSLQRHEKQIGKANVTHVCSSVTGELDFSILMPSYDIINAAASPAS
jgi:hypothetical protein